MKPIEVFAEQKHILKWFLILENFIDDLVEEFLKGFSRKHLQVLLKTLFSISCRKKTFGRISVVNLKEISDRISGQNFRQTYNRISEGKIMYELFEKFQYSNILSYLLYLYIILLARPLAEIFWVSQQKFRRSSRDLRMMQIISEKFIHEYIFDIGVGVSFSQEVATSSVWSIDYVACSMSMEPNAMGPFGNKCVIK